MAIPKTVKIKALLSEMRPMVLRAKGVIAAPKLQPKTATEVTWFNRFAGILADKIWKTMVRAVLYV